MCYIVIKGQSTHLQACDRMMEVFLIDVQINQSESVKINILQN